MRGIAPFFLLGLTACATAGPAPIPVSSVPDIPVLTEEVLNPPLPPGATSASLWAQDPQSLFGNRRARNVGDILTVLVAVDERAQLQNSLERSRQTDEEFSAAALFGIPEWAANTLPGGASLTPGVNVSRNAQTSGDGSIRRSERITLRLAAQVVQKRANGHLVIHGTQRIKVNSEVRDLEITGIVRPEDITRENTIGHEKIAAANIAYTGAGQVNRTTRPGLGSTVLDAVVPF